MTQSFEDLERFTSCGVCQDLLDLCLIRGPLVIFPNIPVGPIEQILVLVNLVFEQRFPERLPDFAFAGVSVVLYATAFLLVRVLARPWLGDAAWLSAPLSGKAKA